MEVGLLGYGFYFWVQLHFLTYLIFGVRICQICIIFRTISHDNETLCAEFSRSYCRRPRATRRIRGPLQTQLQISEINGLVISRAEFRSILPRIDADGLQILVCKAIPPILNLWSGGAFTIPGLLLPITLIMLNGVLFWFYVQTL